MSQTIDIPAPQPMVLLEPELSKLEPVYHLSMEEEAAIATKGVRVTCRITPRQVEYLYGTAKCNQVRMSAELFNHFQLLLRSQGLRQFDIECICIPDDARNGLLALKSVNKGTGCIKVGAPPESFRIPDLKLSGTESSTIPRMKDLYDTVKNATTGQFHKLSSEHTIITCIVRVARRPATRQQPGRREVNLCSGRVNGQEIDIKKVVDRLDPYFAAIYAVAAKNKNQPFPAKLDCTKIIGQDRWAVQRWAEPVSIENFTQRLEAQQAARQPVRPVQPAAIGQAAAGLIRSDAVRTHPSAATAPAPAAPTRRQYRAQPRSPAQETLTQRQAVRRGPLPSKNAVVSTAQSAAGNAEPSTIDIQLRFEICRDANGNLGLRCALMNSHLPMTRIKIRAEHTRQAFAAMQAAKTSVGSRTFRCQRNSDGIYETVQAV